MSVTSKMRRSPATIAGSRLTKTGVGAMRRRDHCRAGAVEQLEAARRRTSASFGAPTAAA